MGRQKSKEKSGKSSRDKGSRFDISQETKNSIWGILSFILAVVSSLSFMDMAGSAGQVFNSVARSLFGWGFFIVPVALLLLAISFVKSISREIYSSAVIGTGMFVLSALGIFFILGEGDFSTRVVQGGYFGVALGWPLLQLVGFTAALIILIAVILVAMLLSLNISLMGLFSKVREEKEQDMDKLVIRKGSEAVDQAKLQIPVKPLKPVQAVPAKVESGDKEFTIKNLKMGKWVLPPLDLLNSDQDQAVTGDINANASIIKRTLSHFGIEVEMGEVSVGPTVTQFTMRPAVGVKLSRITTLNQDLSLALAAHPLRIEAPIPGKSLVGIEVPNKKVALIGLRNMYEHEEFRKPKYIMPIALGRDVAGNPVFHGIDKMPHILIAGATGSGKSVAVNSILLSLLYKHSPEMLKMIMVDPKRVELSLYNDIPHLIAPVITDNKKVLGALRWAVGEMDKRYDVLAKLGTKDILSYNTKMAEKKEVAMPYIVIVIDEMADLMASFGKDVESVIVRLAQMSRAVGIHLILSTQRPSVEVITGLIKANITTRIALQVASQIDSRTILDMAGAEKLLGKGDMLFLSGETAKPRRLQAPMVTEKEIKDVIKFVREQGEKIELPLENRIEVDFNAKSTATSGGGGGDDADDDKYEEAKQLVLEFQKASASFLQRRMGVGYARAARLLDILEENGVVGPGSGAKPREIYMKLEDVPEVGGIQSMIGESGISADTREADREEV